jgi:hypothetical protein
MKLSNVIGTVFVFPGAAIIGSCARDLAHCNVWMIGAGCVMLTLGALIFDPTTVVTALKSLAGIAQPMLPGGGRRFGDPVDRPHDDKPSEPVG